MEAQFDKLKQKFEGLKTELLTIKADVKANGAKPEHETRVRQILHELTGNIDMSQIFKL